MDREFDINLKLTVNRDAKSCIKLENSIDEYKNSVKLLDLIYVHGSS